MALEASAPSSPSSSGAESASERGGLLSIDTDSFQWDKLQELSRSSVDSLRDTLINAYTPITDSLSPGSQVVARLSSGDAWIVRSILGKGTVLWFSFSSDRADSNLPSRAAFVPLVQRIVSFAAGRDSRTSMLSPGEPWLISFPLPASVGDSEQPQDSAPQVVNVISPNAGTREWSGSEWQDTRQQGVYEAKLAPEPSGSRTLAVVDSRIRESDDRRESRLKLWNSKSAGAWFEAQGWTVSESAFDYLNAMRSDFRGREIWSWFWIAAILCFLAEMAIAQSYMAKRGMKPGAIGGEREVPSR
jgi:hypothetical protein